MKNNVAVVRWAFSMLALSLLLLLAPAALAEVSIGISVRVGPPALPVYAQPVCPGPGYLWAPGYWAWNDDAGYYWVPGTWVMAPPGMLWTPGYWGWNEGFYVWHPGYWGPHVGFYGGINYGYGYPGAGFWGGEWRGNRFYYNRSVTNVNVTNVTNVYNRTVIVNNTTVNRVSYNGGAGGVMARPTREDMEAGRESHRAAIRAQTEHERAASRDRQLFASENQGRPAIAATRRPGVFRGQNVMAARDAGAPYHAPTMSPREARGPSPNARYGDNPAGPRENQNAGFRKFGPPERIGTTSAGGAWNGDRGGSWNRNVPRPENTGKANRDANASVGYRNFGGGAERNRGPENDNNHWPRNANRPHAENVSRPYEGRAENGDRGAAPPPNQNAAKPGSPSNGNQRHENAGRDDRERR